MIYLYGLLEEPASGHEVLAGMAGVTGPIALAGLPGGILIYSSATEADILPRRRLLLAHTQVLEAAAWFGNLLPMRFGMMASNLAEVEVMLASRLTELCAAFDRVRDRVELGLRLSFPREPALAATLATAPDLAAERARLLTLRKPDPMAQAEFGRRLAERLDARRGEAQRFLLQSLRPLWVDHRLRVPESDVQVFAVDVLVEDGAQDRLAAALVKAAADCRFAPRVEPALRVIGPVPMFNFVDLVLSPHSEEVA
ncbi:GvpL/GvpF family gas vesicle protein [Cereibacter sphaeroides]|uniref:GvpL/GvpF family gas vesicle protein n=1 Tax=Cereibacter sphaeroides TaxID=1063 RepID=UPI000191C9F1|nr:GvpL/GvpF family gas vesicle protein [Cereibacter sphaeroides]ACM03608.1 Gas vesicle synthesis GvpLGvpF [Cereibacter sphaeroides KD131]EKX57395.1 putative gas vesicle synthesis protein [Rhodobacter sp. AKP1]RHZ99457.1 gas vesicle protein [Cereibacter sphaeroides]